MEEEKKSLINGKLGLPIILVIAGLASIGYIVFTLNKNLDLKQTAGQVIQAVRQSPRDIDKTKDTQDQTEQSSDSLAADEEESVIYSYIADSSGQTPFSLLKKSEAVEYDEYDFGVFVKSINGQAGNDQYFWSLYVNDELASKAGDKIELEPGDKVEWRWEEVVTDFSD